MRAVPDTVRGQRPAFHDQPSIDRLVAMVLALTSEVSVLSDRVRTLEQLGIAAGWLAADAVDSHRPDLPEREAREARREALLNRVFAILREELADLAEGDSQSAYWQTIDSIEKGQV